MFLFLQEYNARKDMGVEKILASALALSPLQGPEVETLKVSVTPPAVELTQSEDDQAMVPLQNWEFFDGITVTGGASCNNERAANRIGEEFSRIGRAPISNELGQQIGRMCAAPLSGLRGYVVYRGRLFIAPDGTHAQVVGLSPNREDRTPRVFSLVLVETI